MAPYRRLDDGTLPRPAYVPIHRYLEILRTLIPFRLAADIDLQGLAGHAACPCNGYS